MFMWKKFLLGLAHLKGSHPPLLDGKVTPKSQRFCPHLWKFLRLGQDRNSKKWIFAVWILPLRENTQEFLPKKYDLHVQKHLYLPKVCKKCVPGIFPDEQNLSKPPKCSMKPNKNVDIFLSTKTTWCAYHFKVDMIPTYGLQLLLPLLCRLPIRW